MIRGYSFSHDDGDDVEGDDADDNDDVHVATVVTEASPLTR